MPIIAPCRLTPKPGAVLDPPLLPIHRTIRPVRPGSRSGLGEAGARAAALLDRQRWEMWSVVVVLPVVQLEFEATRGSISLAFTIAMLGFGPRRCRGRILPIASASWRRSRSAPSPGFGYVMAGLSTTLWQFVAVHFLIGLGSSATFAPLMAEASHWFERYRGLAVTVVASGNYQRRDLAALAQLSNASFRLANHPYRRRYFLRGDDDHRAAAVLIPNWAAPQRPRERAASTGRSAAFHQYTRPPHVVHRQYFLLCGDGDAMSPIVAYCGDLGYGVTWRRDVVVDDGMRHRWPHRAGFLADGIGGIGPTDRIGGPGRRVAVLFVFRQPLLPLYSPHLRDVLLSGWYRAELRRRRPRSDAADPAKPRPESGL